MFLESIHLVILSFKFKKSWTGVGQNALLKLKACVSYDASPCMLVCSEWDSNPHAVTSKGF